MKHMTVAKTLKFKEAALNLFIIDIQWSDILGF